MDKIAILEELDNAINFMYKKEYEDALNVLENTLTELQSDPDIVLKGYIEEDK
jgi:hypothetical protein